jgi:DNA-binding NtrC family response regulator
MNKILVIETDEGTRQALRTRYAHSNTTLVECTLVGDVILRVREGAVAILLSRLADGNELETLRAIKAADPAVPVVAVADSAEEGLRALRIGASYAPRRPVHIDEVVFVLDRLIMESSAIRELESRALAGPRPALLGAGPARKVIDLPVRTAAGADEYRLPPEGIDFRNLEKDVLKQALRLAKGNQRRAAKLLGMTRDQVRYRMAKFDMTTPRTWSAADEDAQFARAADVARGRREESRI